MRFLLLLFLSALHTVHALSTEIPRHVATTPAPCAEPEARERHERILALPGRADARVVFLGDSITERWEAEDGGKATWDRVWAPLHALDLGVSGDRTEHVLWRLAHGALDGAAPRVVVLLIGTNNAGHQVEDAAYRVSPRQISDGVAAIIAQVQARCPAARVLLLAILPRGEEETDPVRRQTDAANALLKGLADGQRVRWLDTGRCFMKAENTDVDIGTMPDLLHPSPEGLPPLGGGAGAGGRGDAALTPAAARATAAHSARIPPAAGGRHRRSAVHERRAGRRRPPSLRPAARAPRRGRHAPNALAVPRRWVRVSQGPTAPPPSAAHHPTPAGRAPCAATPAPRGCTPGWSRRRRRAARAAGRSGRAIRWPG